MVSASGCTGATAIALVHNFPFRATTVLKAICFPLGQKTGGESTSCAMRKMAFVETLNKNNASGVASKGDVLPIG